MEVEKNHQRGDWNIHIHCIFDASHSYQGMRKCNNCKRLDKYGIRKRDYTREDKLRCECAFVLAKLLLEFSWVRITSPEALREYRRNEFQRWRRDIANHPSGHEWNKTFRRSLDVRPAKGEKAVYELVKYVTKSARFIGDPDSVAEFLRSVYRVRMVQKFGRYYKFNPEVRMTKKELEKLAAEGIECDGQVVGAASFLECECGQNKWERIGVFSMQDVEMDATGRWLLKQSSERSRCRGSYVNKGEENDGFH
jgi:hypothetical protein